MGVKRAILIVYASLNVLQDLLKISGNNNGTTLSIDQTTKKRKGLLEHVKYLFTGWYLMVKSTVFIPMLTLSFLYFNNLTPHYPLQGFSRMACISGSGCYLELSFYILSPILSDGLCEDHKHFN